MTRYAVVLMLDSELEARKILNEIISALEFDSHATVRHGTVLDEEAHELANYDSKRRLERPEPHLLCLRCKERRPIPEGHKCLSGDSWLTTCYPALGMHVGICTSCH